MLILIPLFNLNGANHVYSLVSDDEPDDGPQHYVFVSGFRQAPLLPLLADLGVSVSSVIKISSESYATIESIRGRLGSTNSTDGNKDGMYHKLNIIHFNRIDYYPSFTRDVLG